MNDQDLHRRALALLERVLDLDARQRAAILRAECSGQPELRELVESLLAADGADHELLDSEALELIDEGRDGSGAGVVGPYRLLREVGRGGMATVYLAEREIGGVRQRAALKLLRRGIDTDDVVRRFAQESRVLASLEHPNIARFYDAQASPDGRPYLAMEFIEGLPLTAYCDAQRLSLPERLALFRTVCEAVEFAHQRLVVHRDLKPSNILVTDGGTVKLLDFGIAKLLSDDDEAGAPLTRTGMRLLTPEYAAPEQVHAGAITMATDVYALGGTLYELLTGVRANESVVTDPTPGGATTSSVGADRPSDAVRRAARRGDATPAAEARSTSPDRLGRLLHGDLDTIVLKALERDPARRYQSARELSEDIARHLVGRPIEARPATLGYRVRKFARRHRAGVLSTAMAAALLVGFIGLYTLGVARERDIAEAEATKARVTTEFLQRVLGEAYPSVALGDTFSMSDLLSRAVARVDSIDAQPDTQAELLRTLGDVYREQGRFSEALPLLERAVAILRDGDAVLNRSGGRALDALGHLLYEQGAYEAALSTHQESLEVFETLYEPDDSLVLFALNNVAAAATGLDDFEEALRLHELVLSRHERLFADTSELVHVTRNNLGHLYHQMGDYERAIQEYYTAVALRRRALPPDHPALALALNNLGAALRPLDRLEEAERAQLESLEIFQRVFGPDHHRVGLAAFNLAQIQRSSGRYDDAEQNLRLTLSIDRKTYGENHLEVGVDLRILGFLLEEKGDCLTAAPALREADAIFADNDIPLTHRRRLTARARLGRCLTALDRYAEGEEVLTASLAAARAAPAEADPVGAQETADRLIELYRAWGRPGAADSVQALAPPRSG